MIGSPSSYNTGSKGSHIHPHPENKAKLPSNTRAVAQVPPSLPLPHTPTLSIPEIHITPALHDSQAKASKRERFKASVRGVFHKSEGSLLSHTHKASTATTKPLDAEQPKLSKRERLSQLFTSDKAKAQTIYFEEGHPLLALKPKNQSKEEKLSKRKRLSQFLKTERQIAKEIYDEDTSPPTSKSQRKPRPQSQVLPKGLDQRLATPPLSRRNSLDTPTICIQAPSQSQTPTSPSLPPPDPKVPPYTTQEDNPPPRSETKAFESPEHKAPIRLAG